MNKIKCFFWVLIFIFPLALIGQQSAAFQTIKGKSTSSQSITYAVAQDSSGMLWIATEEGVLAHNSIDFKTYNHYDGLTDGLSDRISTLYIDSDDQIFIGTENGVGFYNADLDHFERFPVSTATNPSLISQILKTDNGRLFVAAFNGLWSCSKDEKELKRIGNFKQVQSLCTSKNGIFIAHENKLSLLPYTLNFDDIQEISVPSDHSVTLVTRVFNKTIIGTDNGHLFEINDNYSNGYRFIADYKNKIKDLVVYNSQTIFVATDGNGLFKVTDNWKKLSHFKDDDSSLNYISSDGVYDLAIGVNKELWMATYGGGVSKIAPKGTDFFNLTHRFNDINSIASDVTRAILEDGLGNIWYGTKKGISIWNKKTNSWKHLPNLSNKSSGYSIILSLEKQGSEVYVGTFNHGFYKVNIHTLSIKDLTGILVKEDAATSIYSILNVDDTAVFIAGLQGQLAKLVNDQVVETYPIYNIRKVKLLDKDHVLALGRNGAYKINLNTKNFELLKAVANKVGSTRYSTLNDAIKFENSLLFASNGMGIIKYDLLTNSVSTIGIDEGLPSENIQSIIHTTKNEFWAATTRGLAHVIKKNDNFQVFVYNESDGLASSEFNYGSAAVLENGKLVAFGGINGVSIFDPQSIKTSGPVPKLRFLNIDVFSELLSPGSEHLPQALNETSTIYLDDDQNSIEVSYIGILHNAAQQVTYSYRLLGFNDNWSTPSSQNFQSFTNLSSGSYDFQVRAFNKYGQSSDVRSLKIMIATPLYATNFALFIYFVVLIIFIYGVYHFTKAMIKKRNADEQIAFFNNVTHEIKTPLTILMSSLDKVTNSLDETDDSKKRIRTTVKRINSLFEQMLNFHKVTSQNSITQHVKQLQLNDHIHELVKSFLPLTEEQGLTIKIESKLENSIFHHDRDILDKVILNLLSNAIKYSNAGSEITITMAHQGADQLKLSITDQGIGIPVEQQKHILKKYYRARNVINSQRPGTGLGLVMVKKLLDKTGGSISFKSEENIGSTFTVILNDLKKEYNDKEVQRIHNMTSPQDLDMLQLKAGDLSDAKILICEDNDELRELLVNALSNYFQVFEAINGKEGLDIALQHYPDIILTDLIMPEMDGMQMAKKLKEDINLNHIPVFMLTVLQNSSQKLESIESGVSEYIEKPIDMKILLAKMVNTLNFQKQLRKKYVQEQDSTTAAVFKNKQDQEFLEKLEKNIIDHLGDDDFSVHDLSGSMGMSRTSLYMKLKNLVDLSPQDFIIHTKLKVAKRLLIEGQMNIKEVAYHSGFSNPKYFSTSFKKFYNMTPSGFIDSLKN